MASKKAKRAKDPTRLGGNNAPQRRAHHAVARELAARHPRLGRLCQLAHPLERVIPDDRPLTHLVIRTIVGQLVSVQAARTIMNRLLEAHGDMEGVVAWAMRTPEDAEPVHGLSRAKRKAIAHWGRFVAAEGDPREDWGNLEADDLVARIMTLRGLGRWSAHMVAIFGFGHARIWPEGDAGVVRAAKVVFRGMRPATVQRLIAGHETHVALCCWALLDKGRLAEFHDAPARR
jgi:DNA-3-methyladenine glycosylase II